MMPSLLMDWVTIINVRSFEIKYKRRCAALDDSAKGMFGKTESVLGPRETVFQSRKFFV